MSVALVAKLPKGDLDGLQILEDEAEGGDLVTVVAVLTPKTIEQHLDDDDDPTVLKLKIVRLEVVRGTDETSVQDALGRRYADRTGKEPLPLTEAP